MAEKVKKKVARTVVAYVDLYHAAKFSVERAENSDEPEFYNCLSALLFCAFCLESYLNHIGRAYFENWQKDLEKLSPHAKLRLIAVERMRAKPDFSRRPFQSFNQLFKFRNSLVHGKTETVSYVAMFDDVVSPAKKPLADWEKICDLKHAKRLFQDMKEIIQVLHSYTPIASRNPFGYFDVMSESIIFDDPTLIDDTSPEYFVY